MAVRVSTYTLINLELPAFKNGRIRDDGCSGHVICCSLFERACAISWESDLQTDDPSSDKLASSAAKWSGITEISPSWSGFAAFCLCEAQTTPGFLLNDSVIFFQGLKQTQQHGRLKQHSLCVVEFLNLYGSVTLRSVFKISQHGNRVLHQFTDRTKIIKICNSCYTMFGIWNTFITAFFNPMVWFFSICTEGLWIQSGGALLVFQDIPSAPVSTFLILLSSRTCRWEGCATYWVCYELLAAWFSIIICP